MHRGKLFEGHYQLQRGSSFQEIKKERRNMRSTDQNGAGTPGEYEQPPGARPQKLGLGAIHWNAILALIAIGVLYALLPSKVSIGPSWLLVAAEGVFVFLLVTATLTRGRVSPVTNRIGSLFLLVLVTLTLTVAIGHLISTLKSSNVIGIDLIRSGLLLYCFNILLSALWYWEIDGGVCPCTRHHIVCGLSCHQHHLKLMEFWGCPHYSGSFAGSSREVEVLITSGQTTPQQLYSRQKDEDCEEAEGELSHANSGCLTGKRRNTWETD
jgi:hypothetical protein